MVPFHVHVVLEINMSKFNDVKHDYIETSCSICSTSPKREVFIISEKIMKIRNSKI